MDVFLEFDMSYQENKELCRETWKKRRKVFLF